MSKHEPHTRISPMLTRVGNVLCEVVHELSRENDTPLTTRVLIRLVRGIALNAQAARLAPGGFDCENGRDALSAIAHAITQQELLKLADNNVLTLSERWSKVVCVAVHELATAGIAPVELRRAADIKEDPPRSPYANPKLFDKWMPK